MWTTREVCTRGDHDCFNLCYLARFFTRRRRIGARGHVGSGNFELAVTRCNSCAMGDKWVLMRLEGLSDDSSTKNQH